MKKSLIMGLGLMVGGAVLVLALARQPDNFAVESAPNATEAVVVAPAMPLTTDIATERKILEAKNQEREQAAKRSDAEVRALLEEQAAAKNLAIQKAKNEAPATNLVVQARPEAVALTEQARQETAPPQQISAPVQTPPAPTQPVPTAVKAQASKDKEKDKAKEPAKKDDKDDKTAKQTPKTYKVQAGDNLIRLSRRYDVPVSALAEANNMQRNDALRRGQSIKIPSAKEVARLSAAAKEREEKAAQQKALDTRLAQARKTAKSQGINDNYAVQVALSSNRQSAQKLVEQYKSAGYNARLHEDARGIRVVIPERSREAAVALKNKVNHDAQVDSRGAWVLQLK